MHFSHHQVNVLRGHQGPIHALTFSAGSGQYILTGGSDRSIRLFPAAPSSSGGTTLIQSYEAHGYEVSDLAVTSDNARFASVGGDKQVFLWDVSTARTLRRWTGHFGRVNCVDFGGDDASVIVSGSFDATVRLWDTKSQSTKPIQVLEEATDSVSSLQVTDWEVISGCVDGKLRVYDMRMGIISTDVIGQPITSVQQTNDGNSVLVSTLDSTIRLFDKGNGQLLKTYKGHKNLEYRIRSTLGQADSVVLSGSENGEIFAWDILQGAVIGKIAAHGGKVASAVRWNGNKDEWASAGTDGTAIVWRPRT